MAGRSTRSRPRLAARRAPCRARAARERGPSTGVAPLTAEFSLAGEAAGGLVRADFDSNGTVDFTGPTLEGQSFACGAPGLYVPTVTGTDTLGSARTATAIVQVYDPASPEPLRRGRVSRLRAF